MKMRLDDLERHGLPKRVIEVWRKRQGETLLPVQSKAIRKGLLGERFEKGRQRSISMIIAAPTSSGKSFCAEMAAVKAMTKREKTVMLFPLKSLAEQKFKQFSDTYAGLGIKCLIVTSDHPENDQRFAEGDYQIALVIYEKFDLFLTASLDSLRTIGLIVVDEVQTIAEAGRGPLLERLLTKIIASVYNPSLIALSAVLSSGDESTQVDESVTAERLADWLGAVLVEETVRPVELVRGVAAEGSFNFRSYNSQLDGSEPFITAEIGESSFDAFTRQIKSDSGNATLSGATTLSGNGTLTLVFLKSRMDTIKCAFRLAASVNWPEASQALKKLADEEPSFLVRSLRQAMNRGVAFHSSDLSSVQRLIVEQAFIDREVRVLFSTTTLAMGVNLPADTVYLETVKYAAGQYDGRPSLVPVTRAEFDNMTGRAGRLGMGGGNRPGKAIILADSEFDRDVLWESYIAEGERPILKSMFASMPVADWMLNMISSRLASDHEELKTVFGHTLHAHQGGELASSDFENSLKLLLDYDLIRVDAASEKISAAPLGEATSRSGLSVKAAKHYLEKLKSGRPDSLTGWIALALSGPDFVFPPAVLSRFELGSNAPLKMLYQRYDYLMQESRWLIDINRQRETLPYRTAAALKSFLLLHDWCQLAPAQVLEERFQIHLGQIISLGETIAHLVSAVAGLFERQEPGVTQRETVDEYTFTLRTGLPVKYRSWHLHFGQILNRCDYMTLEKASVESLSDLCELSLEELGKIIPSRRKSLLINKQAELVKQEVDMQPNSATESAGLKGGKVMASGEPESIEIDGSFERERYLVRINGFPVRLTGKSFKYFTKLAWSRLHGEMGWVYKEDLEVGFNQARYLYRMKNEISAGLNINWPIIENNRLGYYRLNAKPSKIHVNLDNLRTHPDYELRELVASKDGSSSKAGRTDQDNRAVH